MPADEMAVGARGRGHFRASDADREWAVDVLKAAFVQDRMGKDEFNLRVGRVLKSRTFADLDALTADILTGRTKARPAEPSCERGNSRLIMRASAAVAVSVVVTSVTVPLLRFPGVVGLITGAIHGCFVGVLLAALLAFLSRVLGRARHE